MKDVSVKIPSRSLSCNVWCECSNKSHCSISQKFYEILFYLMRQHKIFISNETKNYYEKGDGHKSICWGFVCFNCPPSFSLSLSFIAIISVWCHIKGIYFSYEAHIYSEGYVQRHACVWAMEGMTWYKFFLKLWWKIARSSFWPLGSSIAHPAQ